MNIGRGRMPSTHTGSFLTTRRTVLVRSGIIQLAEGSQGSRLDRSSAGSPVFYRPPNATQAAFAPGVAAGAPFLRRHAVGLTDTGRRGQRMATPIGPSHPGGAAKITPRGRTVARSSLRCRPGLAAGHFRIPAPAESAPQPNPPA